MTPLPVRFADRWGDPRARPSYEDAVCWHVLLGDCAAIRAAAAEAQHRLARFSGWHMTPLERLHVTVMRAGTVGSITRDDMERMAAAAQAELARIPPVTVTLSRVLYHAEAIALRVSPSGALVPLREAARAGAREVPAAGRGADDREDTTIAHLTLAYSAGEQAAAPVIAELGRTIPACEITIREMSLVIQEGPEQLWDWRVAGTARLLGTKPVTGA